MTGCSEAVPSGSRSGRHGHVPMGQPMLRATPLAMPRAMEPAAVA
ncbi:hypothetical protein amrb99_12780 [Actinomadura sp. RB99]|nr:hypothetical protein [Actinomadura sp. RB99]